MAIGETAGHVLRGNGLPTHKKRRRCHWLTLPAHIIFNEPFKRLLSGYDISTNLSCDYGRPSVHVQELMIGIAQGLEGNPARDKGPAYGNRPKTSHPRGKAFATSRSCRREYRRRTGGVNCCPGALQLPAAQLDTRIFCLEINPDHDLMQTRSS